MIHIQTIEVFRNIHFLNNVTGSQLLRRVNHIFKVKFFNESALNNFYINTVENHTSQSTIKYYSLKLHLKSNCIHYLLFLLNDRLDPHCFYFFVHYVFTTFMFKYTLDQPL